MKFEIRFGKTNLVSRCRMTHRREALEAGELIQHSGKMKEMGKTEKKEETTIY